jgi:S-DNA-T family DNA segregation ATPase FtsK/SpoIIIE
MLLASHSSALVTTPPPGLRIPWWDRTRPRRLTAHGGRALVVIAHNPRYATVAGLAALAVIGNTLLGLWAPMATLGLAVILLGLWINYRPAGVQQALRGWYRSNREYRWTWGRTVRRCNAAKYDVPLPLLLTTRSTPYVDKLRVKVPTGLDPTAFQDYRGDLLRWGWHAQSVRVFNPQPKHKTVELWNLIKDPLVEPVKPFPPSPDPLPKFINAAMQEDGLPWEAKIRGGAAHVYVCGISGSGKGSVVGAYLTGLQTGIQQKTIEAWGIDPQGSELGMWVHLFAKLVYTQKDAADMLEELVGIMHKRTRKLFGLSRQHHPTPGDPFYFVPIDEALDLLDKSDRKTYLRIDSALRKLLRMGRKASILVMFVAQRAELDIVGPLRKDFQIFIALEQNLETDVDMVLGRGAYAAGVKAHEFNLPGEAAVAGRTGIVRVRFPESDDDHIRAQPPAPGNEDPENLPPPPGGPKLPALA